MVSRLKTSKFHELRCCICDALIGYIRQNYYIKHEYVCKDCYIKSITGIPKEVKQK